MRPLNNSTVFYVPERVPSSPADIPAFLDRELQKIKITFDLLALGHLDETYVAPTKPRNGDIRYADGTSWNPGLGRGVYYLKGTTWTLLG